MAIFRTLGLSCLKRHAGRWSLVWPSIKGISVLILLASPATADSSQSAFNVVANFCNLFLRGQEDSFEKLQKAGFGIQIKGNRKFSGFSNHSDGAINFHAIRHRRAPVCSVVIIPHDYRDYRGNNIRKLGSKYVETWAAAQKGKVIPTRSGWANVVSPIGTTKIWLLPETYLGRSSLVIGFDRADPKRK